MNQEQEFVFYQSEDGSLKVQVVVDPATETMWATQKAIATLFSVSIPDISYHLSQVYDSGELDSETTVKKILTVVQRGFRGTIPDEVTYYNLDVIISVGYRVNSHRATRFRQWASRILKEYLTKGFVLDDDRLKAGGNLFGKQHFDELLERVQEIRASERMFYQKLTDMLIVSEDYDKDSPEVRSVFAFIQNKLEYAVTGKTSAEIIVSRINADLPNCGLLSWKDQKKGGKIQYSDTTIAKNYMSPEELSELTTLVNLCLDSAILKAKRQEHIFMTDWVEMFNMQLKIHGYEILHGKGIVSADQAKTVAREHWDRFRPLQDARFKSEFDLLVEKASKR